MKNIFILLGATLFLLSSCEEKKLEIPPLSVGKRRVIVEEMTGVQCQGCPEGTRELIGLQKQYGEDNLIVVSIHAAQGTLSEPFPNKSKEDYRSAEIQKLADFIGQASFVPTASISRVKPQGALTAYQARPWGGAIATEFSKDYGLGIFMNSKFDTITRKLDIDINLVPDQNLDQENRLTVLITQDSIVDYQLDGVTLKPNYVHRHLLRDVVSAPEGDIISEPLLKGSPAVTKRYSVELPQKYVAKHCSIVAYVHGNNNPTGTVYQAVEKHIIEK